jgi:hypothetical protein
MVCKKILAKSEEEGIERNPGEARRNKRMYAVLAKPG